MTQKASYYYVRKTPSLTIISVFSENIRNSVKI